MEKIKIYYKGELDTEKDNLLKDALGRKSFSFTGSGYDLVNKERDLEFEYQPVPDEGDN